MAATLGEGVQRRNAIGNSVRNTGGDESALPPYTDLLWPTLQAVIEIGGSGVIEEIDGAVIARVGLSEADRAVLHGDGPGTEIEYRIAWARTYLKGMGLLSNTRRGVWSVTDDGRAVRESEIKPMQVAYTAEKRRRRLVRNSSQGAQVVPLAAAPEDPELWREPVLGAVADLPAEGFERLVTAVLRSAGFTTLTVPAPGGGTDSDTQVEGTGILRVSLLSFSVFFRFVRGQERAGADVVREFRAAMVGRGEGPAGVDRILHRRCACGGTPARCSAHRSRRRRGSVRPTQGARTRHTHHGAHRRRCRARARVLRRVGGPLRTVLSVGSTSTFADVLRVAGVNVVQSEGTITHSGAGAP